METPPTSRHGPEPDGSPSEEAIAWFARLRSEQVTDQDRAAFERWRAQSPTHARAFHEITALWNAPELVAAAAKPPRIDHATESSKRLQRSFIRPAAAAAAVLLVLTVAVFQFDLAMRVRADHVTAVGERRTITLADQSTVILNTNSAVASHYRPNERRVRLLKGEALFRVQPDRDRPFLVDHRGVVARAVGTAFIVRERPQGFQITVVEGVVALDGMPGAPAVTLRAGEQALVASDGTVATRTVNPDRAAAWTRGWLVFDSTPFADVLEEMSRYHSGYVALWNPALAGLRVSGSYKLTDTNRILTTLAQTLPVHMTRLTDRIILFH